MTPKLARLKRKVRDAIDQCGGIDGAGATAERSRSVAGDWHNLNHKAFPTLDCALALDEAVIAQGKAPPIASATCRELGGVFVPLPDCGADPDSLAGMVMGLASEVGDVARRVSEAVADQVVKACEAEAIEHELDELDRLSARLRLAVRGQTVPPKRMVFADGVCGGSE